MAIKNIAGYVLVVIVFLSITTAKNAAAQSNKELNYWYEIQSDSSLSVKGLIKIQAGGKSFTIPPIQEGIKGIQQDTTTTLKFSWRGDGVLIINLPKGTRMQYVKVNPKNLRRAAKWYAKYAMGDMKAPNFGYRRILRKAKAK